MASDETTLRELSFGVAFFKNEPITQTPTFISECIDNIDGVEESDFKDIKRGFSEQHLKIIQRGFALGKFVIEKLDIDVQTGHSLRWLGNAKADIFDFQVGDDNFSLKDNSDILTNSGLKSVFNDVAGREVYKKSIHAFEDYALEELETWFQVAVDLANTESLTYEEFKALPTNRRRQVKREIQEIKKHPQYIASAKNCALVAGDKITESLNSFLEEDNVDFASIFNINKQGYYLGKTGNQRVAPKLYKIPSRREFEERNLEVVRLYTSVPKNQLNIRTEITNTENGLKITLNNEVRYSHGPFWGTPEAKRYHYEGSLGVAYEVL